RYGLHGNALVDAQTAALLPFVSEANRGEFAEGMDLLRPVEGIDQQQAFIPDETVRYASTITVVARRGPRGALGSRLLDNLAIQAGTLVSRVGNAVQNNRALRWSLTALGYGLDAVGGPAVFLVRQAMGAAIGAVSEAATARAAGRFSHVGYGPGAALLGGVGTVLLGTLLVSAGRAIRHLPTMFTALKNLVGQRPQLSGTALARQLGIQGERIAGVPVGRTGYRMPSGRMRFPDNVTRTHVIEVKNVARQGWTAQLRDYSAFANDTGRTFELRLRPGATISSELRAAWMRGDVTIVDLQGNRWRW
ncbi:MAG: putative toxin, partial [Sphingorhabdus sp.]|uniref:putative toxin n=1 Tax=Sphingorhabdus sp. TaxID=1902408 RepID=UPI003CB0FE3C